MDLPLYPQLTAYVTFIHAFMKYPKQKYRTAYTLLI